MTGQTHAVVGANAVWVVALAGGVDQNVLPLVLAGALAGLLPDLDARNAKIHFIGGGVFSPFRGVMKHRGFMHSLFFAAVITILSFLFLFKYHPLLPVIIGIGYVSHLIIDGLNFSGVPYFFPWRKDLHLLPKFLRTRVNGIVDHLLFIAGICGIIFFIFQNRVYLNFFYAFGN